MSINWYPGHMHKARKEIIKTLNKVDLLIEIVDARLPFSSQNPVLASLRQQKPTILVFNKCDLANPKTTQLWQAFYKDHNNIKTLNCQQNQPGNARQIITLCQKMVPEKAESFKTIQAMIVGIPNVGKSTIINTLAGKTIAKTGNEPAVTKAQQKILLDHNITLHDTPGILWPKIDNQDSAYRLAISGAIKNTAIVFEDIGFYAADYFLATYPEALIQRYQVETLPETALELLELIGIQRGARQAGGRINLHKCCEILLHDYRAGHLGLITLETPAMIEKELIKVELLLKEKAAKKEAKKGKQK